MPLLTCVVIARNEEKNIKDCLESVKDISDEIILVDDASSDRTQEIAKSMGARVYERAMDDFSSQRNFGLEKASHEWVLFIDADEILTPEAGYEIKTRLQIDYNFSGFYLKRQDFMWGKKLKHGEWGTIKLLRLCKKDAGKWEGKVHEVWKVNGKTGSLNNYLFHYPHATISDFLKKINFYTDIRAKELLDNKVKVSFLSIILYPKAKFIWNYIFKLGILDGIPGLMLSIIMSLHSFLVRGKLWQLHISRKQ